jgi:hypothetical protein
MSSGSDPGYYNAGVLMDFCRNLQNTGLTSLDLSKNNICNGTYRSQKRSYEAIQTLASCMCRTPSLPLRYLDLSDNFLDPAACKLIAGALATNPPLLVLDLSRNQIAPNDIEPQGAVALAKALLTNRTLSCLVLTGALPTDADFGRSVENVGSAKLPTLFAAALHKNPNSALKELDLRHNRFGGDSDIRGARVAVNTAIQRLGDACKRREVQLHVGAWD